jgi:uncharacterized protein (TIGR02647 family)
MRGLKIHHDVGPALVIAAQPMQDKGIVYQPDGGYLTGFGHDHLEHVLIVLLALTSKL